MGTVDLLLVGAGHAHLHLIEQAPRLRAAGWRVRLLAPPAFHYSGVASAVAARDLPVREGLVDVVDLARRRGVPHVVGRLSDLDLATRTATGDDGSRQGYDVVSLNIGSVSDPAGVCVADDVLRVKPLDDLAGLDRRIRDAARGPAGATVTVVGAGSSGVELAAHLAVRPDVARVQLVEAGEDIAADLPRAARRRLRRLLAHRGVDVRVGWEVRSVSRREAVPVDGLALHHDVALVATGLAAPQLVTALGLGDRAGIPVRATLQHRDHDEVYAAGDCARFLPQPLPRVGVHGVRQGPVLLASLLARAAGEPLPVYEPQRRWLSVLDLGDGQAVAARGRLWWSGRSALALKRRIDRRWIATYRG